MSCDQGWILTFKNWIRKTKMIKNNKEVSGKAAWKNESNLFPMQHLLKIKKALAFLLNFVKCQTPRECRMGNKCLHMNYSLWPCVKLLDACLWVSSLHTLAYILFPEPCGNKLPMLWHFPLKHACPKTTDTSYRHSWLLRKRGLETEIDLQETH